MITITDAAQERFARRSRPRTRRRGGVRVAVEDHGLAGVAGREEAVAVASVEDVLITVPPGHPVAPPPEGGRHLGFLFSRGTTADDVEAALRAAHRRLRIEIDPQAPLSTGCNRAIMEWKVLRPDQSQPGE